MSNVVERSRDGGLVVLVADWVVVPRQWSPLQPTIHLPVPVVALAFVVRQGVALEVAMGEVEALEAGVEVAEAGDSGMGHLGVGRVDLGAAIEVSEAGTAMTGSVAVVAMIDLAGVVAMIDSVVEVVAMIDLVEVLQEDPGMEAHPVVDAIEVGSMIGSHLHVVVGLAFKVATVVGLQEQERMQALDLGKAGQVDRVWQMVVVNENWMIIVVVVVVVITQMEQVVTMTVIRDQDTKA